MAGLQMKTTQAASYTAEYVAELMNVNVVEGLSTKEAERRTETHGKNEFTDQAEDALWKKYLQQFREPMIMLLMASAAISIIMQQYENAMSISGAIIIVVTVAFIQGYRSEKAIEALKGLMPPRCQCLRDGSCQVLYARDLVPGDVVYLQMGDRVPADMRLYESTELCIDESSFTGETEPVHKVATQMSREQISSGTNHPAFNKEVVHSPPSETLSKATISSHPDVPSSPTNSSHHPSHEHTVLSNMAYLGTLVRCGSGKGIVTSTGCHSEFGELFRMMQAEEAPRTPLQRSMDTLGKQLTVYSFVIIAGIGLLGLIQKRPIIEVFTIAVSLAVAAIPEGLPIVVTVTLAIGQMRMAKRDSIVKKLPAVETLGCVNVVCCDKTGTLTKNEMTVTRAFTSDGLHVHVTGVGYSNVGEVVSDDNVTILTSDTHSSLRKLAEIAYICNNAYIHNGELRGQPTEGALLCFAAKCGLPDLREEYSRVHEIPFSPDTKIMKVKCVPSRRLNTSHPTSLVSSSQSEEICFVKGATDRVLKQCSYVWINGRPEKLTTAIEEKLVTEARNFGRQGLRVLALARSMDTSEHGQELVCHGIVGIIDPPRPGVEQSINILHASGVRVCMLTGDAKETACAIGQRLGLFHGVELCFSGDDIEEMSVEQLAKNVHNCTIFYRVSPRHKCKIVKAFQQRSLVVAMTGDGVNDAVALKSADIGVAMGRSGTDVCKEAADIVLVNDDFSSILAAMEEGKAIFNNIRNFVRFQLSTSIAALTLISLSTLFSLPNPLNAMQILWINILMDGPPAQSLGVEPVDPDVICQPPRPRGERILTSRLLSNIIMSAVTIVVGTLWIFYHEMRVDGVVSPRDTTMTFTCFVLFDMFNALSSRSQTKSIFEIGFTTNRFFLLAVGLSLLGQLLVIYFPPLRVIFQTEALSLSDLVFLVVITSSIFWLSEIKKITDRYGCSLFRCCDAFRRAVMKTRSMKSNDMNNFV